jgi:hypothetical protein
MYKPSIAPIIGLMIADQGDQRLLAAFLKQIGYCVELCNFSMLETGKFAGSMVIADELHARRYGNML